MSLVDRYWWRSALMRYSRLAIVLAGLLVLLAGIPAFAQTAAPAATWSVSDCQGCHEDKAFSPAYTKSKHAQADQSCANCHENVAEHAKAQMAGEKGPVPSMKHLKAERDQRDVPHLPREGEPGQLSRAACTRAATWPARRATACTRPKSVKAPAQDEERRRHLLHLPQVRAREVDAHVAPPGARRQDGLRELPQPARRQPAEDDQGRLGQRALLHVPHREARSVPLRARAGPRRLRVLPRTARHEPQAAAARRSCRTCAGTAT